ncbi:MAG: serine hydrolase domain-containing protein [Novosphingobium sp.]
MRIALAFLASLIPSVASAQPATVAVAFDRTRIRPVLAEGEADRATHRMATADDPVRIASISKLVTTLGVMRLVDQGKLDLDRDVSDYLGYRLRNPAFPGTKITLRLLLSHQSSLLDGEDRYIIPLGETLQTRLTEPALWDTVHAPGSGWFHYTNLNFPVVASVMERVTGERFDRLMARLVLRPLKLEACFNWSGCSPAMAARAVVLYRASGEAAKDELKGVLPGCPVVTNPGDSCDLSRYVPGSNGALFSPQGGLRISMRGMAKVGQLLARGGRGFVSHKAFAEMTEPEWRFDGSNGLGEDGTASGFFCTYGLALHRIGGGGTGCHDNLFGDTIERIGHSGDAYGLKAGLWVDPVTGRGLAFFTSAVADDSKGKRSAFTAAEEAVVDRSAKVPFR